MSIRHSPFAPLAPLTFREPTRSLLEVVPFKGFSNYACPFAFLSDRLETAGGGFSGESQRVGRPSPFVRRSRRLTEETRPQHVSSIAQHNPRNFLHKWHASASSRAAFLHFELIRSAFFISVYGPLFEETIGESERLTRCSGASTVAISPDCAGLKLTSLSRLAFGVPKGTRPNAGAFCLDVRTSTFSQLMGFPH